MKVNQAFSLGCCHVLPLESAIKIAEQEKQSLQPKFIEVLHYLAREYPRVIPREELINQVWDGNDYVGEKGLTNAIWHLRQKLNAVIEDGEAIETIRKVGYRLLIQPQWNKAVPEPAETSFSPATDTGINLAQKPKLPLTRILLSLCLLLTLAGIYLFNQPRGLPQAKIIPVTKDPGTELFPAPSPDGRYVAYQWRTPSGTSNLYLKDLQHGKVAAKQLTFDSASEGHSVWSHSGNYLYFARYNSKQETCDIVQLDIALNQETNLTACPATGGYYYMDISPDDKTLAFRGSEPGEEHSGIYFFDLKNRGQKPKRFSCLQNCGYKDRDFAFSPDGRSLAVTRRVNRFNENLYLVDLTTKAEKPLTTGEEDIVGISWHPQGQYLVYATQRADIRRGFILDVNNLSKQDIGIEGFSYPAFAKQSGALYYHQRKENYQLASFALNMDVATSPFPLLQSEFSYLYPDYSNTSGQIVYVSNESGFYELWLADADGQHRQQLTQFKRTIRYPAWSHRGDKIAFLAPTPDEQKESLYILDVATHKITAIKAPFSRYNRPGWSPDDSAIISSVPHDNGQDLFRFAIDSSSYQQLTNDGARYGVMISDNEILYTSLNKGLWYKNLAGNSGAQIKIPGNIFNGLYSWHYFQGSLYFKKSLSKAQQLMHYDFANKQLSTLIRLPRKTFQGGGSLTMLASEHKLLFSSSRSPQADIKQLAHPLFN
ncbi:winged helix-turn-helix domain-containing protein [Thalassomonas haliotis]|uniref:PD40 domain-containing protein n=1 Tax=Thalassomonas haliotis TaxID=485448 RepID=A0ABY7VEI7_9GAMM|nr:winged helix-turn-helix domain-containing protein [Thalassomonas haliotis]WDE11395.1 PD40 domain-containing protein [Thalassomonas haliotis]